MLAKRIIPCLDVKDGRVVKGINFLNLVDAGDPVEVASIYSRENADVLDHLKLAQSYIALPRARLYITHGYSGSGKSWWSEKIARVLPAIHNRSDVERSRENNVNGGPETGAGRSEALAGRPPLLASASPAAPKIPRRSASRRVVEPLVCCSLMTVSSLLAGLPHGRRQARSMPA